ncbi:CLUMA_CG012267, isoform A [Clunio marinus]|uniref:CLUMA_CG012267, isoform A n=1 Tax=Clunio marinus TaxID=568069 RepID=A0A1J1IFH2_9DIPT|nr:CLUMA_CG012267, isoform A [Clunio marinus]
MAKIFHHPCREYEVMFGVPNPKYKINKNSFKSVSWCILSNDGIEMTSHECLNFNERINEITDNEPLMTKFQVLRFDLTMFMLLLVVSAFLKAHRLNRKQPKR